MSKWSMDPEAVCISGGSIEIHPADYVPVRRKDGGTVTYGDPLHVQAVVRVFLHSDPDGFFAFSLTPAQAQALAASVERHCPDADPSEAVAAGAA